MKENIIKRLLGKRNDKLLIDCVRIFELFDPPEPEGIPEFPLSGFLADATKWNDIMERIQKEKDEDRREFFDFRLQNIAFDIAFGIGFVFGHMFDIPNPKVQKNIEAIKRVVKEKQLLPFVPRERRGP